MLNRNDIDFSNSLGISVDIHLISCGASKADDPQKARDLYVGSTFQRSADYAARRASTTGTGPASCLIVSALHGLVDLDTEIAPYDTTIKAMSKTEKAEWVEMVRAQVEALGIRKAIFHVHAGQAYIAILREALAPFGRVVNFFDPRGEGAPGIGDRRGFYRRTAESEASWFLSHSQEEVAMKTR